MSFREGVTTTSGLLQVVGGRRFDDTFSDVCNTFPVGDVTPLEAMVESEYRGCSEVFILSDRLCVRVVFVCLGRREVGLWKGQCLCSLHDS